MSAAIAIFVKTPGLSSVKTRLAAGIGEAAALEFYDLSVKAVADAARQAEAKTYWAVAEEEGLGHWLEFKALYTGGGSLGVRQRHVYETLRLEYKNVLLIGADAPQLSPEILNRAIAALENSDFVIGPARDGGYYLFGGRVAVDADIWAQVPWSANDTREVFESLLPSRPFYLSVLTDVDREGNLQAAIGEMPKNVSAAQKAVVDWVLNR
ncbi:MAG: glycosyltransferase [Alphaproteobacteria bacterium]